MLQLVEFFDKLKGIAEEEYRIIMDKYLERFPSEEKSFAHNLVYGKAFSKLAKIIFYAKITIILDYLCKNPLKEDIVKEIVRTRVEGYARLVIEAINNSNANLEAIKQQMFGITAPGDLVLKDIDVQGSDPHKGGKRVAFLTYSFTERQKGMTYVGSYFWLL